MSEYRHEWEPYVEIPFLTDEEAAETSRRCYGTKAFWETRKIEFPFHTLGGVLYMDACHKRYDSEYVPRRDRMNPILRDAFGLMFDKLAVAMTRYLGKEAFYDERLGLPGLHICLGEELSGREQGAIHFDFQYREVDWKLWADREPDFSRQISFTVPISIQREGAGLNVWTAIDFRELKAKPIADAKKLYAETKPDWFEYKTGTVALHSGHHLHQGTFPHWAEAGQDRITIQGHALPVDAGWILYW